MGPTFLTCSVQCHKLSSAFGVEGPGEEAQLYPSPQDFKQMTFALWALLSPSVK